MVVIIEKFPPRYQRTELVMKVEKFALLHLVYLTDSAAALRS